MSTCCNMFLTGSQKKLWCHHLISNHQGVIPFWMHIYIYYIFTYIYDYIYIHVYIWLYIYMYSGMFKYCLQSVFTSSMHLFYIIYTYICTSYVHFTYIMHTSLSSPGSKVMLLATADGLTVGNQGQTTSTVLQDDIAFCLKLAKVALKSHYLH